MLVLHAWARAPRTLERSHCRRLIGRDGACAQQRALHAHAAEAAGIEEVERDAMEEHLEGGALGAQAERPQRQVVLEGLPMQSELNAKGGREQNCRGVEPRAEIVRAKSQR